MRLRRRGDKQDKDKKVEELKKEEDWEQVVLPSIQWRPIHPGPLVLGLLVSDANPEGIPVASGQEVPNEGLAGGAAGCQRRSEEDFQPPPSDGAAESYLLLRCGDDGQVASSTTAVVLAAEPALRHLRHEVAAAAEGLPAVGAGQQHWWRPRTLSNDFWTLRSTKEQK